MRLSACVCKWVCLCVHMHGFMCVSSNARTKFVMVSISKHLPSESVDRACCISECIVSVSVCADPPMGVCMCDVVCQGEHVYVCVCVLLQKLTALPSPSAQLCSGMELHANRGYGRLSAT